MSTPEHGEPLDEIAPDIAAEFDRLKMVKQLWDLHFNPAPTTETNTETGDTE